MATIKLDPKYQDFSDELVRLSRARGVFLADYAEGLLRLCAEAWFEEPPSLKRPDLLEQSRMRGIALDIVNHAFEDKHVQIRLQNAGGRVSFTDLFVALADSGRNILRDFVEKGF